MSSDPQLGLFPSHDTIETAAASDASNCTAASSDVAAVAPVASPNVLASAHPRAAESVGLRRKDAAIALAKPQADERYLSVQDVAHRYAISVQTVWRHTKHNPAFPKPIKILNGSTRWRMSDILAFEVSRQEVSR